MSSAIDPCRAESCMAGEVNQRPRHWLVNRDPQPCTHMFFHSFCCPNFPASRALRIALEDGAGEGGVGVAVLPVAVQVEGADAVRDQVEDAEDLQWRRDGLGILVRVCSAHIDRFDR